MLNLADINTKPLGAKVLEFLQDCIMGGTGIPPSTMRLLTVEDLESVGF